MIPTAAEPIVFHSGPVDGVRPQGYPITYGHLINSICFDLEASTLFIYYSQETTKKFCQFCFEKLPIIEQNKYEFRTSWQCSQNVDVNGPHHRCFELIVSSSVNQPMELERGRSHELVGSMVGTVYVHVLRTLRSWYSVCKIQCVNMNCNGCREALITPRCRATDCKGCTEQFLKNKMQLQLGNEVIVENVFR